MDFKNFKLADLNKFFADDTATPKITTEQGAEFTKNECKQIEANALTIGEHQTANIYQGSENLYFDFYAYFKNDDVEFSPEIKIHLYTKENKPLLKEFIKNFINEL